MVTGTSALGNTGTTNFNVSSTSTQRRTVGSTGQDNQQIEMAAKDLLKTAGSPETALELVKGAVELAKGGSSTRTSGSSGEFTAEQMKAAKEFVTLASPEKAIDVINGAIAAKDPNNGQLPGVSTLGIG